MQIGTGKKRTVDHRERQDPVSGYSGAGGFPGGSVVRRAVNAAVGAGEERGAAFDKCSAAVSGKSVREGGPLLSVVGGTEDGMSPSFIICRYWSLSYRNPGATPCISFP